MHSAIERSRSDSPSTSTATASRRTEAPEWMDAKATERAQRAAAARGASKRRRFVDPTTCERDYNAAELEFMLAMNEYKQKSGRMFPTWSEVLEVLISLGYEKPGGLRDLED